MEMDMKWWPWGLYLYEIWWTILSLGSNVNDPLCIDNLVERLNMGRPNQQLLLTLMTGECPLLVTSSFGKNTSINNNQNLVLGLGHVFWGVKCDVVVKFQGKIMTCLIWSNFDFSFYVWSYCWGLMEMGEMEMRLRLLMVIYECDGT